jgi:hypothetical protein
VEEEEEEQEGVLWLTNSALFLCEDVSKLSQTTLWLYFFIFRGCNANSKIYRLSDIQKL